MLAHPIAHERQAAPDPAAGFDAAALASVRDQPEGAPVLHAVISSLCDQAADPSQPPPATPTLMNYRPLRGFTCEQLDAFLHRSRMVPSRSRFGGGIGRWVVPRRDITVRAAMATLRERLQQGVAMAEVIAQLEREFVDENPMDEDEESVVVASGIRDCLREALGMLGIFEQALTDGVAVLRLGEVEDPESGDMP